MNRYKNSYQEVDISRKASPLAFNKTSQHLPALLKEQADLNMNRQNAMSRFLRRREYFEPSLSRVSAKLRRHESRMNRDTY